MTLAARIEVGIRLPRLDEAPQHFVARLAMVRIDPPTERSPIGLLLRERLPRGSETHQRFQLRGRLVPIDTIIDGDGRRPFAASQARSPLDYHPPRADLLGHGFQVAAAMFRPGQVAGHVATYADLDRSGRLEVIVGKEARHFVKPVQRHSQTLRQPA